MGQIELNCKTELFEIEMFEHLTVSKQKTVFKQMTYYVLTKNCT